VSHIPADFNHIPFGVNGLMIAGTQLHDIVVVGIILRCHTTSTRVQSADARLVITIRADIIALSPQPMPSKSNKGTPYRLGTSVLMHDFDPFATLSDVKSSVSEASFMGVCAGSNVTTVAVKNCNDRPHRQSWPILHPSSPHPMCTARIGVVTIARLQSWNKTLGYGGTLLIANIGTSDKYQWISWVYEHFKPSLRGTKPLLPKKVSFGTPLTLGMPASIP
jgi:hypothetical protein